LCDAFCLAGDAHWGDPFALSGCSSSFRSKSLIGSGSGSPPVFLSSLRKFAPTIHAILT
jgi:hypothetical protein